jgi:hypothetical protein
MWPWALGSAALGGLTAYQQSGGDLGKTLMGATIGGGLGLAVPGASRMAGQALQNTGVLTPLASGATKALGKIGLAGKFGLPTAVSEQALRTGAGVVGRTALGTMAIPAVAAGAAGIPGQIAGGAATAAGVAGVPGFGPQRPGQFNPGAAVPSDLQALNHPYSYADAVSPIGPLGTARTTEELENDLQIRNYLKMANAQYPIISQAKKDEMSRQLAAAQIRANIGINTEAMLGGLGTARTIGINAANQLGSALAAQYNYG